MTTNEHLAVHDMDLTSTNTGSVETKKAVDSDVLVKVVREHLDFLSVSELVRHFSLPLWLLDQLPRARQYAFLNWFYNPNKMLDMYLLVSDAGALYKVDNYYVEVSRSGKRSEIQAVNQYIKAESKKDNPFSTKPDRLPWIRCDAAQQKQEAGEGDTIITFNKKESVATIQTQDDFVQQRLSDAGCESKNGCYIMSVKDVLRPTVRGQRRVWNN